MSDFLIIWMALCTLLVLLMQAGFICFEAGMVRRKNSTNVALKNAADVGLSVILFLFIGYPLLFGSSEGIFSGFIGMGYSPLFGDDPVQMLQALFQAMFAGTAMTIISGAVSERTTFRGYLVIAFFMTIFIYPITGHWAWSETGWLYQLGFYDFAGGTVVHVVGGAIALAAIIHIGPRIGRFDSESGIEPSNLAFATLGMLVLFFGWFGFNAGAATSFQDQVPLIMVNTALGATAGLFSIMMLAIFNKKIPEPNQILCAPIAGLVAITAGCAILTPLGAVVVGLIGSIVAQYSAKLLEKFKLDDPVGAIPVHLSAGVVGTILIPLFAYDISLPDAVANKYEWFFIQLAGTLTISVFAFFLSYLFIGATKNIITYRVNDKDEMVGLNVAEHNAETAMFELIKQMSSQGEKGNFNQPISAEPGTDAGYIAFFYNQVRDKFLNEANRSKALLEEANHQAYHDALTGLFNRRAYNEAAQRRESELNRYGTHYAIIMMDIDHFKNVNDQYGHDVGDEVLVEFANRLKHTARDNDIVARTGGEEFTILCHLDDEDEITIAAERFRKIISLHDFETLVGKLRITTSAGVIVVNDKKITLTKAMKLCDDALYEAKRDGRNRVSVAMKEA